MDLRLVVKQLSDDKVALETKLSAAERERDSWHTNYDTARDAWYREIDLRVLAESRISATVKALEAKRKAQHQPKEARDA